MNYASLHNINDNICFKHHDGGVMKGTVVGIQISVGWISDETPSDYDLRMSSKAQHLVEYSVLVPKPAPAIGSYIRAVEERRTALTFEEAWKLA